MRSRRITIIAVIATLFIGCATYFQTTVKFQNSFFSGNFEDADNLLKRDKKGETGINRLLYFYNRGTTNFMLGESATSNEYFEKADSYIENYTKNLGSEALALVTNPMLKPYVAEDFESVMIHFYKALNYLNLNNYEDAIVECRRINITLQKMEEKYKKEGKHYTRDAFAHNLMGIIYEAAGNTNDAFIAYRNALEVYEQDYIPLFNTAIPEQLKKDLIRTASKMGFGSEQNFYEEKFNIKYDPQFDADKGSVVAFWLNGQGPVKAEWSLMLTNVGCHAGVVTFANEEMGFSFPLYIGGFGSSQQEGLKSLSFLRIAFPKYVERPLYFNSATFSLNDLDYKFETAENINNIAFQSLKDRIWREVANSLVRVALKKTMEATVRNQNEYLGLAMSLTNALSERADTRNWQTLPYSISYSRIPLSEGEHTLSFNAIGRETKSVKKTFTINKNKTTFLTFTNLESTYIPVE